MGHPNSELAQGTHPSQGVGAGHPKPVHVNTSRGHNKCQVSQWSVHLPTRWSWVVSPSRQILRIGLGFHIDLVKLGTRKCPRDVKVVVVMLTTSFVVCRLLYKKTGLYIPKTTKAMETIFSAAGIRRCHFGFRCCDFGFETHDGLRLFLKKYRMKNRSFQKEMGNY